MHTRIGEIRKKNKFAQQKTVESHNQSQRSANSALWDRILKMKSHDAE